ncbi:MAG: hypothetical protein BAJALOKI3v1_50089 [Promethearchaeota archaeon]|nr:MAG: hypothetical protein BAJALOKI3v1_50089 [Candidatus Lokiarchaeota archaeon]
MNEDYIKEEIQKYLDRSKAITFSNQRGKTLFINKIIDIINDGKNKEEDDYSNTRNCVIRTKNPEDVAGYAVMTPEMSAQSDEKSN